MNLMSLKIFKKYKECQIFKNLKHNLNYLALQIKFTQQFLFKMPRIYF